MFEGTEVTKRLGLLVPPTNVVMEVELFRSLPPDVTVHTSHMDRSTSTVSADAMLELVTTGQAAARSIRFTLPDVVIHGCTAASFLRGIAGDAEVERLVSEASGRPTITTSTASVRCLRSIGARRLAVAAPYPVDLTRRAGEFLNQHGFEVCSLECLDLAQGTAYGRTTLQEAYDLGLRADRPEADALFISGTGLRTLEVIGPLEAALGKPVISANLASLWAALAYVGEGQRFRFGESRLDEWQRLAV